MNTQKTASRTPPSFPQVTASYILVYTIFLVYTTLWNFGLYQFLIYTRFVHTSQLVHTKLLLQKVVQTTKRSLVYTTFWSIPLFRIMKIWCRPKYGVDQKLVWTKKWYRPALPKSSIDQKLVQTMSKSGVDLILKSGEDLRKWCRPKVNSQLPKRNKGEFQTQRFFHAIFQAFLYFLVSLFKMHHILCVS